MSLEINMDKNKQVESMIQKLNLDKTLSEEKLNNLRTYLQKTRNLAIGYLEDAVHFSKNSTQYSIEEFYQAILDN